MSFLMLVAPGIGRRQAGGSARLKAKCRRLQDAADHANHQLRGAGHHIVALRVDRDKFRTLYDGIVEKAGRVDEAEQRAAEAEATLAAQTAELIELRQFKANVNSHRALPDPDFPEVADDGYDDVQPAPAPAWTGDATGLAASSNTIRVTPLWAAMLPDGSCATTENIPVAELPADLVGAR